MEEVALSPPYALIPAGESLHWMEWDVVFPRFAQRSTPHALLVIVELAIQPVPWWEEVRAVLKRYASYQAQSSDLVHELTTRGFFEPQGERLTAADPWCPWVASYLTALHSRSSLSREALGVARLAAFDRHLKKILTPVSVHGCLQMEISARLSWKVKGG
jgi:hypothetical protein